MTRLAGLRRAILYYSFPLSFIGFILPIYASSLGFSSVEIGLLYSIFALCSILIRPLVGNWIDSKGRRKGLIVGLIFGGISLGLFYIGSSYEHILAARIFQSVAASFTWVSVYAMISDVSDDDNRSTNLGLVDQSANKGEFIGAFIGFSLLFLSNFDNPLKSAFMVFLIFSALSLLYGLTKVKETHIVNRHEQKNDDEEVSHKLKQDFKGFLILVGLLSLVGSISAPVLLLYVKDFITKDISLISFLFIPGAVLAMFLPGKLGAMADKYGQKTMLIIGIVIQAVFTLLIPVFKNYYSFMILYTILTLSVLVRFPAQTAFVTIITQGRRRGRRYGLYSFSTGIGRIIGPLLGSAVYQYMKADFVFYIQGVALIIITIVAQQILRGKIGTLSRQRLPIR